MKQYYYTVSALPAVQLEEEPFFSEEAFLEHCASFVSPTDMKYIAGASLTAFWDGEHGSWQKEEGTGVLQEWFSRIRDIQAYLAEIRAHNLGREYMGFPEPTGDDPLIQDMVKKITAEENPHRAELFQLQLMWDLLDDLEPGHFFDRDKLAIYYLRLQIAFRRHRISDVDEGNTEFTRQYDTIAQAMMEIV